jgi:very-long-chain (3R)-3-hydroxyacyl-CoA dehydratase
MDARDSQTPITAPRPLRPLQSSSPKTQYLIIYNFVSALLWLVVLGRVLALVPLVGFGKVYIGVGHFAKWTQTLALLEIVHAVLGKSYILFPVHQFLFLGRYIADGVVRIGIVRAPVLTTAMQVASRILLVWGIVEPFPFLAKSAAYSSMLTAWSVTEVIRYSFFTLNLSGLLPEVLSWLRYNTFYVLYPLGISSEYWLIYKAVGPAKEKRQEYAWLLQLILFAYVPGELSLGWPVTGWRSC